MKINKKKIFLYTCLVLILSPIILAIPGIEFVAPTPTESGIFMTNLSAIINFTIDQGTNPLDNINWSWNMTNYSFFGDDLLFMVDFDSNNYSSTENEGTLTTSHIEGFWHFDEGSGATADDNSPNDYDGTLGNGASFNANGFHGGSVDFDGINDEINFGTLASAVPNLRGTSSGFTTGAWIYMNGTNNAAFNIETIISGVEFFAVGSKFNGHELRCLFNVLRCQFQIFNGTTDATFAETPISMNQWYFLVGVFNGSHVSIWLDGELKAIQPFTGPYGQPGGVYDFMIGDSDITSGRVWNGSIDEPFFFDRPLIEQEILLLNNSHWQNLSHIDGKYNNAYYGFTGNNLNYPTAGNFNNHSGTIEMWVKPSWDIVTGATHILFDMRTVTNTNRWLISKGGGSGALQWLIYNGTNGQQRNLAGGAGEEWSNKWNHVVVSWEEQGGRIEPTGLWLNGVLLDSTIGGSAIGGVELPTTMYIGSQDGNNLFGNTAFDEIRIYNHSFTQDEVIEHYYGNLKKLNETRWRFEINHSDLVNDNVYTYQGCATDNAGNLNCTDERNFDVVFGVEDCQSITSSGKYGLIQDIDNGVSECIDIVSADVTFDCGGHTIDATLGQSYGIRVDVNNPNANAKVSNCILTNWNTFALDNYYGQNNVYENIILNNTDTPSAYNYRGIRVYDSYTTFRNIEIIGFGLTNNECGMRLQSDWSNFVNITNVTITDSKCGINLAGNVNNLIVTNSSINNAYYGLYFTAVSSAQTDNLYYNNFINATIPVEGLSTFTNDWNTTEKLGPNIIGGNSLGGNYYAKLNGQGFSENCADGDGDGFCDEPYDVFNDVAGCTSNNCDYLALTKQVDTQAPYVNLYSPVNESFLNGGTTLSADANDNIGIDNVTFAYINSTDTDVICVDTTAPYSCLWNTDEFSEGGLGYDINATAWDARSNSNSSLKHYSIDRSLTIVKDLLVPYPITTHQQSSIRDTQEITLEVSVIDSPETAAGVNVSIVDLTDVNGTGNFTMIQQNGSTDSDKWSTWSVTANVSGTTGTQFATVHVFDLSNPNNVNSGNAFLVIIDNENPTYDNSTYYASNDNPINNTNVAFVIDIVNDNFDLDRFIFSNNMNGVWENSSSVNVSGTTNSISNISTVFNNSITEGEWSYKFYIFDDAGNINETEERNISVQDDIPDLTIYLDKPEDFEVVTTNRVNISWRYENSMADNCTLMIDKIENYTWFYPLNFTIHNVSQVFNEDTYAWDIICIENVTHTEFISEVREFEVLVTHITMQISDSITVSPLNLRLNSLFRDSSLGMLFDIINKRVG